MPYSVYARKSILNWFWRALAFTQLTGTYLALLTTNPSDDSGTGLVEMTTSLWTGYTRTTVAATVWNAPSGTSPQTITNGSVITPAGSAASAVTVTGFAIYDATSAGNMLGWGTLNNTAIPTSSGISFAVGVLTIQE